jgi:hypothetical protein
VDQIFDREIREIREIGRVPALTAETGLAKVRYEWSLTTLAYNLKRVLNLASFEKLMAAVG